MSNWKSLKRKGILWLLLCAISVFPYNISAQWLPDKETEGLIRQGIEQVYNIQLDSALTVFQKVVDKYPHHPGGHFFIAMVDWIQILMDFTDESLDQQFFDRLEQVIKLSDEMLKKNSNDLSALFFKGGAIGFRGRLRAHRGQWIRAANDGRRALPIVRKASELAPDNADVLLGTGIYNYYAAVIPERYSWVRPFMIFFPSGNKEEGLNQLRTAAQKGRYANFESAYFLMQILYFYERNYIEGYQIARNLSYRFPNNPLFHRYYGRYNVVLGRWSDVYDIFSEVKERYRQNWFGYGEIAMREAVYYIAQYHFTRNEFKEAIPYYEEVLEYSQRLDENPHSGFIVLTTLRMAMSYDALGERERAVELYQQVRRMDDYQGSRATAERYLRISYLRGATLNDTNPHIFSP